MLRHHLWMAPKLISSPVPCFMILWSALHECSFQALISSHTFARLPGCNVTRRRKLPINPNNLYNFSPIHLIVPTNYVFCIWLKPFFVCWFLMVSLVWFFAIFRFKVRKFLHCLYNSFVVYNISTDPVVTGSTWVHHLPQLVEPEPLVMNLQSHNNII